MRELDLYRRKLRRLSQRWAGVGLENPMLSQGHAESAGREAEILALPVKTDGYTPLVDDDGNLFFMAEMSALDGGDALN